ncbi:MAG: DNA methylase [Spirochaetales bacterium]|nr:DNA methylase [Spirochaetales bacterium]
MKANMPKHSYYERRSCNLKSDRLYICIDLKSFFASVECVERHLDPMTTKLVVADPERSKNTICLAITPAMKALGIKNRCRVFQIPPQIQYIMAVPRMQLYIDYAAKVYGVYLKYVSPTDIHVYSVDEAFLDVTDYLKTYNMNGKQLGVIIMEDIFQQTGIRATCGIGTNLYLAKIALDITAKHSPNFLGILNEEAYRNSLWHHKPLTDFWRIGRGTANRLAKLGITDMAGIAQCREDLLYSVFGKDAELLIDHAWGIEPTTIADIKSYRSAVHSISSGQVLMRDYTFDEAMIIIREMTDMLCLDLVDKDLVTSSVTLWICYSNKLNIPPSNGSIKLNTETNGDLIIIPAVIDLYSKITDKTKPIRRINISFNNVHREEYCCYSLFEEENDLFIKNRNVQKAVINLKKRFGKNAILRGMDYREAATARERNQQIGGHKSGVQT